MKYSLLAIVTATIVALTLSSCEILDQPSDRALLVPRTVDEDPTLPSIFVNGTQLHAETFGNPNNPMIVMLHGGPGGDYRYLLKATKFAEDGFFVVFYDQRGSGLSRRHDKEVYTTNIFIDDLDAVIQYYQKPGQKVILIGQSWGAMLATSYVNQYPDKVSGVVLTEPGGFTWKDTEAYVKKLRSLKLFDEASNDFVYVDQFLTGSDHEMLDYKAGIQAAGDFVEGNTIGSAGPFPFWRIGAVCNSAAFDYARKHSFDFTTNLQQYTTRVLFMYSELNKAYGRSHAELVSSAYPNVQLVEITGSGHEIPYFGWDQYYAVTKAYLNTIK